MKKNIFNVIARVVLLFSFFFAYANLANAQAGSEQTLDIKKSFTPSLTECNVFDVTLTATGLEIERAIEVILVIDRSGSMNSYVNGQSQTLMDNTKDAALEFVENMFTAENNPTGENRLGIVSYSTTGSLDIGLTGESGKASIISAINRLSAGGGTNIAQGIDIADTEMSDNGTHDCPTIRAIVVMTDGCPNYMLDGNTVNAAAVENPYYVYGNPVHENKCTDEVQDVGEAAWHEGEEAEYKDNHVFSVVITGGIEAYDSRYKCVEFEWRTDFWGNTIYRPDPTNCRTAYTDESDEMCKDVARTTMKGVQNSGFFESEDGSDMSALYTGIFQELNVAAKSVPQADGSNASFLKNYVSDIFNLRESSIETNEGEIEVLNGNTIDWQLVEIAEGQTATMEY